MDARLQFFWVNVFLVSFYFSRSTSTSAVYIVYLGLTHGYHPLATTNYHIQILSTVFKSEDDARQAIVYSYRHSFSGFAARLNSAQANRLSDTEGVISIFRGKTLQLHTTRSWDFMGLSLHNHGTLTPLQLLHGDEIVVGIFDTGICPESNSFRQSPNMGPIPCSWKGTCVKGESFDPRQACNRKLIGARYYLDGFESEFGPLNTSSIPEYRSARDHLGHGTHTASTAVGSVVNNASFLEFGRGTARGGAPLARLAVYKVCWSDNLVGRCTEADIMAAFDDAIRDGVHVISGSFGVSPPLPPVLSSSADIGSFHAAQRGIFVVFSAGNDGPDPSLVQNVAPWSMSVAATSIDRSFPTSMVLGNNITIRGQSFNFKQMKLEVTDSNSLFNDGICEFETWTGKPAKGKAVLCFSTTGPVQSGNAALAIFAAAGSALIFATPITRQIPDVDFITTIIVDMNQGTQILHYIFSNPSKRPTLQLFPSKTIIGGSPAPTVAYFSSRGPSSISPDILKPDISAPGVNILAAWPPETPPSLLPFDTRSVHWNFDSGTSMSCPHVAGIVALIKSAHPDWSPAAIRSALLTTAQVSDSSMDKILAGGSVKPVDAFDVGGGQVNPTRALDPGLVYDMETEDYVPFLCNRGFTEKQISKMVLPSNSSKIKCPKQPTTDSELNYPSITVSDLRSRTTIKRTVRNVGSHRSVYFVSVTKPDGVLVNVWPKILLFSFRRQKLSYFVTFVPLKKSRGRYNFGEIVWWDGSHRVRSPLTVRVNNIQDATTNGTCLSA